MAGWRRGRLEIFWSVYFISERSKVGCLNKANTVLEAG